MPHRSVNLSDCGALQAYTCVDRLYIYVEKITSMYMRYSHSLLLLEHVPLLLLEHVHLENQRVLAYYTVSCRLEFILLVLFSSVGQIFSRGSLSETENSYKTIFDLGL